MANNRTTKESENKKGKKREAFLKKTEEQMRESYQLSAEEVLKLILQYNKKYEINIVMNGVTTEYGKEVIEQKKESQIESWNNEDIKESHNLVEALLRIIIGSKDVDKSKDEGPVVMGINEIKDQLNILHKTYLDLAADCPFFFKSYPKSIKKLIKLLDIPENESQSFAKEDLDGLTEWIKKLTTVSNLYKALTVENREELQNRISQSEEEHQLILNDFALSKKEAINEIKEIRINMEKNAVIGYVFTNNHLLNKGHFDVIIITKDFIIKPCEWLVDEWKTISSSDIEGLSCLEMIPRFICHENPDCDLPFAQAGATECGTLGLLYLKELLKNNSYQLKNFTMNIPFYDEKNEKLHYFFIPSPDVLRYSQSGTFNDIILSMFKDQLDSVRVPFTRYKPILDDPFGDAPKPEIIQSIKIKMKDTDTMKGVGFTLTKLKDTAIVQTLVAMLKDTLSKAILKQDEKVIKDCETLLRELPEFRIKWTEKYKQVMESSKRTDMQKGPLNYYLAYSTQRFFQNAEASETSQNKTKASETSQNKTSSTQLTKQNNK